MYIYIFRSSLIFHNFEDILLSLLLLSVEADEINLPQQKRSAYY